MSSLSYLFLDFEKEAQNYKELKENCKLKAPENFNFAYDVVDVYARKDGKKQALLWCDDNGEEESFTFLDISRESKRAAYFLASKGIKKGDAVMLILRRRYEFWFLILALHRIGAIVVPATDQLLHQDIKYRIDAAEVKMIISYENEAIQSEIEKAVKDDSAIQLMSVGKGRDGWIDFHKDYSSCEAEFPRPVGEGATKNTDPMLLYFTSGTSGYPKMVLHNFLYPIAHLITAKYWHCVVEDGLHLAVAETGWAKATWGKIYGQWIAGSAVFVYDMTGFKPHNMLKKIEKYGITTFCAPPTIYRYLIRQDLSKYDLSSVIRFTTAGEALNPEVFNKFYEFTGKKIYEGYGQTETTILIGNFLNFPIRPGSMGKASPAYDLAVIDKNGREVNTGEVGELVIKLDKGRPMGLLTGYYRDVTLTANAFDGGVYHTGDTVYKDKDDYFWFVGRKDDIIKSAGFRISPFEVESVLQRHPSVMECAVTGVEDEKRGQMVKATVVLSPGYTASHELELELFDFMRHHTAQYKCPRSIEFVEELPKTISGKIRRVEIREKDKGVKAENVKQEF